MKLPHIAFRYSSIYDQQMKHYYDLEYYAPDGRYRNYAYNYPSRDEILEYRLKVETLWNDSSEAILKELVTITTLSWHDDEILCYLVGRSIPFSDPLTIPCGGPFAQYPDYFIDTLTHELVHQLFIQKGNSNRLKNCWHYFFTKYKDYPKTTQIHIPLHAIHAHIFHKLFTTQRLEREIRLISSLPDYKQSWDTVNQKGYQNIIKEFVSKIEKT